MPIEEILNSHTEGQLAAMSIASEIQYRNFMRDSQPPVPKDDISHSQTLKPKKPFKQMTKAEVEAYYMQSGVF